DLPLAPRRPRQPLADRRARRRDGVLAGPLHRGLSSRGRGGERALLASLAGRDRPRHRRPDRGGTRPADRLPGGPGRQARRRRAGIFLLPSLLTTGNLFGGFGALLLTVESRYTEAALAILVAMVMDILDGRVARLIKATTQFGLEFDSLADVVSFCVAPAFLIYSFALSELARPAWFGAFLFVICGALRLARFNIHTGTVDRRFFVGLPTPAAAG